MKLLRDFLGAWRLVRLPEHLRPNAVLLRMDGERLPAWHAAAGRQITRTTYHYEYGIVEIELDVRSGAPVLTDAYVTVDSVELVDDRDTWGDTWTADDVNRTDFGIAVSGTETGPKAAKSPRPERLP